MISGLSCGATWQFISASFVLLVMLHNCLLSLQAVHVKFVLSSCFVSALACIQLFMLHLHIHDVQVSRPHTASVLYNCYISCCLVQSLCKASTLSFCHCLMRSSSTQFLSSAAMTSPPIHDQVISWLTTTAIPISSKSTSNSWTDWTYSVNAQTTLWDQTTLSPSPQLLPIQKRIQTSLLFISSLVFGRSFYKNFLHTTPWGCLHKNTQ